MSRYDITVKDQGGLNVLPTRVCQTEAAATAIYAGEPVIIKSAGSPYVIPMADGTPVIGTTVEMVGIAKSDGTHTASADGTVEVYVPTPSVIFAIKAKSAAAVDTAAEVLALVNDCLLFDLTSSAYTIDTAAGHVATGGLEVVGGDHEKGLIYFKVRASALQGIIA